MFALLNVLLSVCNEDTLLLFGYQTRPHTAEFFESLRHHFLIEKEVHHFPKRRNAYKKQTPPNRWKRKNTRVRKTALHIFTCTICNESANSILHITESCIGGSSRIPWADDTDGNKAPDYNILNLLDCRFFMPR